MIRGSQKEESGKPDAVLNRTNDNLPIVDLGSEEDGFLGWADNPLATAATYLDGETLPWFTSDKTLYAVWKPGARFHRTIIWWSENEEDKSEFSIKGKLTANDLKTDGHNILKAVKVKIGVSVSEIDDNLFKGSTTLKSVSIGNGVKTIGENAFYGCTNIRNLTLGSNIKTIKNGAFNGCNAITGHLIIPNSTESIGNWAFQSCGSLTGVTITDGVTSIGEGAFYGCSGLKSITIPDSVTHILTRTFSDCSGLTSVTIGNGVTNIQYEAFAHCGNIENLTLGSNVTRIGRYAFNNGHRLTNVTILTNQLPYVDQQVLGNQFYIKKLTFDKKISDAVAKGWLDGWQLFSCNQLRQLIFNNFTQNEANELITRIKPSKLPSDCEIIGKLG